MSLLARAVEMIKSDVHSALPGIQKAIDNFKTLRKSDEWLVPQGLVDEDIARVDKMWEQSIATYLNQVTVKIIVASLNNSNNKVVSNYFDYSCTDLDTYANMVVLSKHYYVINDTGETA